MGQGAQLARAGHVVSSECERVSMRLAAPFSRLMCLLGEVSGIEAWDHGLGAKAIADRKCLRRRGVLVAFSCAGLGKGHWLVEQLARRIVVDESSSKRVVAFLGQEFSQPCVVLELASTKGLLWSGFIKLRSSE